MTSISDGLRAGSVKTSQPLPPLNAFGHNIRLTTEMELDPRQSPIQAGNK